MNIGIIGSGIVGHATGVGLENLGNDVSFYDIDIAKTNDLIKKGFDATNDLTRIKDSDVFFICVPTPDNNGKLDFSYIKSATRDIAKLCKNRRDYFSIVIKSTIVPMTTEKMIVPLIEKYSKKTVGNDFGICFNPEFLRDEHAYEDFMNPDRIVIGEYDKKSGDILEALYTDLHCPIIRTDIKTAEMSKYANNCFYATKISFFNEIHMMCQAIGIDSNTIRKIVQLDKFYGIHPWEHGHNFGGKCLPKDLNAIIETFNEGHIHDPILLKAVRGVNEQIKK